MTEWDETWSDGGDDGDVSEIESVMGLIERDDWNGIITKAEFILGLERKEQNALTLTSPSSDSNNAEESCLAHLIIQFDSDHQLEATDDLIRSCLFHYAATNQLEMIRLMLHRVKVNPNLTDQNGNTACHLHVHTVQMAKEFNQAGADFGIANQLGQRAMHLATGRNQSRLVSYMLTETGNINQTDHNGESILFYAVRLFIHRLTSSTDLKLNHVDLIQLGNMIKSFKFGGADFDQRNAHDQAITDLVLDAMNTIGAEDTIASVYDIYPTSDAPLIEARNRG